MHIAIYIVTYSFFMRSVLSNMPYANNKSANQTFRFIYTLHVIYAKFGDSSSLLYLARMDGILYWKTIEAILLDAAHTILKYSDTEYWRVYLH